MSGKRCESVRGNYEKALRLEYLTVGYSLLEATIAIFAGLTAGSVALLAWGMDSVAELMSGVVLIWRLKRQENLTSVEEEDEVEGKAVKLVGLSFLTLAGYVLYETIKMLTTSSVPSPSSLGIVIAIAALIFMPILSYKKYILGGRLELRSLLADAKETLVCSLLSLALLAGLTANYLFGYWQIDPLVSLLIVGFLFKEGGELILSEG